MMLQIQSGLGLFALLFLAWLIGEGRRRDAWKIALAGALFQIVLALILLKIPVIAEAVAAMGSVVNTLEAASRAGTSLVFGYLGGSELPFAESYPGAAFVLAFRALPIVLVVSALAALLTHWRILPWLVKIIGLALERGFHISGALGLASTANIFAGMIEAPLFVRPYLKNFDRSELFVLMTTGMATIAGTVFVLYATILSPVLPDAAGQLLVASVISAPAAIAVALMMIPGNGKESSAQVVPLRETASAMEAIVTGTEQGLRILLSIIAMLIVLVALVYLANAVLGLFPDVAGEAITLQRLLGLLLTPITWLMGVPWDDAFAAGRLLATKIVLNELIAYLNLASLPAGTLSDRSELIMIYAICGFANFGSLGIMIGGLSVIVPERRQEILSLGLRSIVAGVLATCCTGCVIGLLTPA